MSHHLTNHIETAADLSHEHGVPRSGSTVWIAPDVVAKELTTDPNGRRGDILRTADHTGPVLLDPGPFDSPSQLTCMFAPVRPLLFRVVFLVNFLFIHQVMEL